MNTDIFSDNEPSVSEEEHSIKELEQEFHRGRKNRSAKPTPPELPEPVIRNVNFPSVQKPKTFVQHGLTKSFSGAQGSTGIYYDDGPTLLQYRGRLPEKPKEPVPGSFFKKSPFVLKNRKTNAVVQDYRMLRAKELKSSWSKTASDFKGLPWGFVRKSKEFGNTSTSESASDGSEEVSSQDPIRSQAPQPFVTNADNEFFSERNQSAGIKVIKKSVTHKGETFAREGQAKGHDEVEKSPREAVRKHEAVKNHEVVRNHASVKNPEAARNYESVKNPEAAKNYESVKNPEPARTREATPPRVEKPAEKKPAVMSYERHRVKQKPVVEQVERSAEKKAIGSQQKLAKPKEELPVKIKRRPVEDEKATKRSSGRVDHQSHASRPSSRPKGHRLPPMNPAQGSSKDFTPNPINLHYDYLRDRETKRKQDLYSHIFGFSKY